MGDGNGTWDKITGEGSAPKMGGSRHRTCMPTPSRLSVRSICPEVLQIQSTHLVVTTTVGVVHWVHGHTTRTRPRVALSLDS